MSRLGLDISNRVLMRTVDSDNEFGMTVINIVFELKMKTDLIKSKI